MTLMDAPRVDPDWSWSVPGAADVSDFPPGPAEPGQTGML